MDLNIFFYKETFSKRNYQYNIDYVNILMILADLFKEVEEYEVYLIF